MRRMFFSLIGWVSLLAPVGVWAQQTPSQSGGTALQATNILNPNLSAIGWFQAEAGHRKLGTEGADEPRFLFKEAELALQSVVDPYARADFFVAVEGEGGVDLEEGYITWFALPAELQLKLGKFKANFGKFNRTHRPETAFADRPLVHETYLGEEGLASTGGSLSWHIPNPWWLAELDAEALTLPEAEESPTFGRADRNDLLYVGRLSSYHDLTEALNVTVGVSGALGKDREFDEFERFVLDRLLLDAAQVEAAGAVPSAVVENHLYGADVTLRWKNPRRSIYRSLLWQTEALWNRRERTEGSVLGTAGVFTHIEYQFTRRWRSGARGDWTQSPTDRSDRGYGGLGYVTFTTSEFCRISLQGKQVWQDGEVKDTLGFLKVTFNIGPHGADPF